MVTFVHYPTVTGAQSASGERFLDNMALEGPIPVMVRDTPAAIRRNMSRRARRPVRPDRGTGCGADAEGHVPAAQPGHGTHVHGDRDRRRASRRPLPCPHHGNWRTAFKLLELRG
jgi:hypothetical protein